MEPFRIRVRKLMDERNMDWDQFTDICGVNRVSLWRSGDKTKKSTVAAIAYALNTTTKELTEGTELNDLWA